MKDWLETIWWRSKPAPLALQFLAQIYAKVSSQLAERKKNKAQKLNVPVIVVGNIAIGGSGKTPITLWLINTLKTLGYQPGVISRGYGGKGPFPQIVTPQSEPLLVGDEPTLMAQRSHVPVCVAPNRYEAGQYLLQAHPEVNVIICDDGLQHYQLARDIELCVIDGARGHGNSSLIPAGPLREPISRLKSCNALLINGAEAAPYGRQDGRQAMRFDLHGDTAQNLVSGELRPIHFFTTPIHAVAGIGNPARFFNMLRAKGLQCIEHSFADHHNFCAKDLQFADAHPIVMTEKDAVKCKAFQDARLWFIPVNAQFNAEDTAHMRELLQHLLK